MVTFDYMCATRFYWKSYIICRMEPTAKQFLATSNGNNSNGRPATPVEHKRSPTHGRLNGRTKVISGTKREPFVQLHPKGGQSPPHQASSRYVLSNMLNINK